MRKWAKQGLIFNVNKEAEWMDSYATGPVVDMTNDRVWRIYYNTRDSKGRSRPTFIEVETGNPKNILYVHDKPLLDIGKIGTFDDCGVSVLSLLDHDGKKYMYYLGWTVRNTVSYHNSLGLAISEDGGKTFQKFSEGPLLSPTYREPYCNGASFTMKEGNLWRLWYTSFVGWEIHDNHPEPLYNIKYAESENGIDWNRNQIVSVDFIDERKIGIARPSVIKEDGIYKMWYCYRGASDYRTNKDNSYRMGYAESSDGKIFVRMDDKIEFTSSGEAWDSVMMTYPHVVKYKGKYWMFYNGNTFGKTGFGYATKEA
ncbi:MAG: hypothetical protein WCD70_05255 [Alphaproteobacteria bacterium]